MRITEIPSGGTDDFRRNRLLSRREFLKIFTGTVGYLLIEASSFGWSLKEAQHIGIDVMSLEMPNFPPEWNGTVVIQLTDLHIGADGKEFFSPKRAEKLAYDIKLQLQAIRADPAKTFIINTGDTVSSGGLHGTTTNLKDVVAVHRHLAGIPGAGRFVLPGNHDEGHPMKSNLWDIMDSFGYLCTGFNSPGSIVHTQIPGTQLAMPFTVVAGPDWTTYPEYYDSINFIGPRSILLDQQVPTVFATHNASVIDLSKMSLEQLLANVIVLTGHTHGMQIKSNLLLQRLAGRYALRYRADYESRFVKGLYQLHNEDAKVYVGPGVGFSSDTIVRTVEPKVSFFIFSSPRK